MNGLAYFWGAKHKQQIVFYLYFYVPWIKEVTLFSISPFLVLKGEKLSTKKHTISPIPANSSVNLYSLKHYLCRFNLNRFSGEFIESKYLVLKINA